MFLGYLGELYKFVVRPPPAFLRARFVCRHDASYGPSDTPQDMITRLKHLRPAFELREQFSYNNIVCPPLPFLCVRLRLIDDDPY